MAAAVSWQQVQAKFKQIWGYDSFRPPQGDVIRSLLEQRDALIVMPTGGGKSVCFQLPALLQSGATLIVSPLVALIEDQVQELRQRSLPAACLHSGLASYQKRQTLQLLRQNRLRLLYLSPETLLSKPVWQVLAEPTVQLNGLVLDEAHCLVQWGDTFRPTYRRLGAVRPALLAARPPGTKLPIAAFTATANPAAQATLGQVLQLQSPKLVRLSPYRSNINPAVQIVWTPRGRRRAMVKFIDAHPQQAGLVYVRTRRTAEEIAHALKRQGYSVQAYHGGLASPRRRRIEADWLGGRCRFVICTSAFGMGINHPQVRWVCHYHAPSTLSEYVQEIGRGGRDGEPANALTLVSEPTGWLDPEDRQRWQFFSESSRQLRQEAGRLIKRLPQRGHIDQVVGRSNPQAATALALLHAQGRLRWETPFEYRLVQSDGRSNRDLGDGVTEMRRYLFGRRCRWQQLMESFGFGDKAQGMRCGHCDRCTP